MLSIESCKLPEDALLNKYAYAGAYTDCYRTEFNSRITHAQFVEAFYTTWLFKLERFILKYWLARPSTDSQAIQLAQGKLDSFAAWLVEERCENQLLLTDFQRRTRSWLMIKSVNSNSNSKTCLLFGSAVVPARRPHAGTAAFSREFYLLIAFHRIYSKLLLYFARMRLEKTLYKT